MRHVGGEIGPRDLGRPNPAEIAGHFRIEMQGDEFIEVTFAQSLRGQPVGGEVVHGDGSPSYARDVAQAIGAG
jgi:hypothetical protein